MTFKALTSDEARVILHKGTEPRGTGRFNQHKVDGTYTCRQCGAALFASDAKFDSGSGWPSFDDALPGAVREVPDTDGQRVEIVCDRCNGHLGHVFRGERMTTKDTRHCVNSVSMDFSAAPIEEAFFGGGCFWGVEHYMQLIPGVERVDSGYMGGDPTRTTYEEICTGRTGHAEIVRVRFDPSKVSYETVAKMFFEIHDPTDVNGQGPDRGTQYRSVVFAVSEAQARDARALITQLEGKGLKVATKVQDAERFWPAEAYHQDYYQRTGKRPYCHARTRRF